ncbi:MAG: hypothetical protein IPN69_02090 [Acidobacteria bacterium]|nr:hypothetical protein [Acidobacteriota bacterium]
MTKKPGKGREKGKAEGKKGERGKGKRGKGKRQSKGEGKEKGRVGQGGEKANNKGKRQTREGPTPFLAFAFSFAPFVPCLFNHFA